ncbi:NRDE family protein [Microbacterium sp.]|uniref:NRDE family protein n=1 Tax=Microbacterium sp. TaxID=51671 RepID=UPI002CBFC229|nr:NRDE family protein [Microbacterium sp.]HWK76854.1 NRDE family protein [Microbacterium sp.]
MCTVVIDVAEQATNGTIGSRLLAVRDEDPERAWDSLGPWWPEQYPGVIGIRDRRAGGAWLAVDRTTHRLAVLLNRADVLDLPEDQVQTRGSLALESVAGRSPAGRLPMHGFNLLEVGPDAARVLSWDGQELTETPVPHGVHMIAHDGLDDPSTARIARWLPEFRARAAGADDWEQRWIDLLAASAELDPTDDAAIIRDNRPHGYPTQSLLYCVADIGDHGVEITESNLTAPGHWG